MKIERTVLMIGLALAASLLLLAASVFGAGGLQNPGLEAPFVQYDTYKGWPLQVAEHWEKFIVNENTYNDGSRLRFFSASDWAALNGSPVVEHVEGSQAQVWWSSSTKEFDAGVYQQITGLTPGEVYGFSAGVLQVFETTNRTDPATGVMARRVGIDPTGGTDPTAATVLWGPSEEHATFSDGGKKYTWFWPSVGAKAVSSTVTVFVRVSSTGAGSTPHSDQVWADAAFFDTAPTTTLTIDRPGPTQAQVTWQGAPRAGYHLFAYEAQYKKVSDADWTDLQIFDVLSDTPPTTTGAMLTLEPGTDYLVRARTWQEQDAAPNYEVAGPWTEQRVTAGGLIEGATQTNRGTPFSNVTVGVANIFSGSMGGASGAVSGADGRFSLATGPGTFGITATTHVDWTVPQPVRVTVPATATAGLTITLRPPDDIFLPSGDGDFENTLGNWQATFAAPNFISATRRSGQASLCISQTGQMTYTALVTDMYRPVLSFWVRVNNESGADSLTAEVFGADNLAVTPPVVISQTGGLWRHVFVPLTLPPAGSGSFGSASGSFGPPAEVISGLLGAKFTVAAGQATFCLDEVSLGGSFGGPRKIFLPLILKGG